MSRPRRKKKAMPAPPSLAELWPSGRFAGVNVVTRHKLVMEALSRTGYALKDGPKRTRAAPVDPLIAAVAGDATVIRLIGAPVIASPGDNPWPDAEAPSWIRIDAGGVLPLLRIGFRGALIRTVFHRESDDQGRVVKVEAVESERLYDFDALKEAAEAARQALRAAGFSLSAFWEVERLHGGQAGVAAIGLRSLSPARTRGPTMAR